MYHGLIVERETLHLPKCIRSRRYILKNHPSLTLMFQSFESQHLKYLPKLAENSVQGLLQLCIHINIINKEYINVAIEIVVTEKLKWLMNLQSWFFRWGCWCRWSCFEGFRRLHLFRTSFSCDFKNGRVSFFFSTTEGKWNPISHCRRRCTVKAECFFKANGL